MKIMVDNLIEEVIDPEIQKINNFLIKIYLETLQKLCKNQMYENSLFDSKGIFLHEITIKNRYFQNFVKEKL